MAKFIQIKGIDDERIKQLIPYKNEIKKFDSSKLIQLLEKLYVELYDTANKNPCSRSFLEDNNG